jgi:hypothetical protein
MVISFKVFFEQCEPKPEECQSERQLQITENRMRVIVKAQYEKLLIFAYQEQGSECFTTARPGIQKIGISADKSIIKKQKLVKLKQYIYGKRPSTNPEWSDWDRLTRGGDEDKSWKYCCSPSLEYVLQWMELVIFEDHGRRIDFWLNALSISIAPADSDRREHDAAQRWLQHNLQEFDDRWPDAWQKALQEKERSDAMERVLANSIESLNQYLLWLNYSSQEFFVTSNTMRRVGVNLFLLEIASEEMTEEIQRWLLYRLLHKDSSLCGAMASHRQWSRKLRVPPASLWDVLRGSSLSSTEAIGDILEESRTVLITVRGMENMETVDGHLSRFIDSFMDELSPDEFPDDAKLFIILVGQEGWLAHQRIMPSHAFLQHMTATDPQAHLWGTLANEGSVDHVTQWGRCQPANTNLPRLEEFLGHYEVNWRDKVTRGAPDQVIQSICQNILKADENLTKLNRIWDRSLK